MRCVFGLARPDRGEVRWKGAPVDRDARLRFGYMPEQRGLYPRMRVARAAQVLRAAARDVQRGRRRRQRRWLERMGLADRAKSKLEELSHGNQQRVQLATALRRPGAARARRAVLRSRPDRHRDDDRGPPGARAAGVGVVFSSHQLDLVEDVCEDVVIIARGRIVAAGAIDELKARSGRRHLEVEVVGSNGDGSTATAI